MSKGVTLNREQREAVECGSGPVLIVAGAGTGKTLIITERLRWLVEKRGVRPSEILALTFTEKAAEEMIWRVDEVMPLGYEEPWLSTFHSFCDRLLRQEALEVGLDPAYKILTASEQRLFIRERLFAFDLAYYRPLGNPSKFIGAILTLFSRLRDEDVAPEEFARWAESKISAAGRSARGGKTKKSKVDLEARKWAELAKAYRKYQELKVAEGKFDFGDLIFWTLKLFRERPNVLAKYQEQFAYVLVDEFQDTNYAQYQLLKLLAPPERRPNLMVVGCDDQAIYKFRGASVSNILNFKNDYPEAKALVLTKNYRSAQPILSAAYKFIQNNNPDRLEVRLGLQKKLKACAPSGARALGCRAEKRLEVLAAETGEAEAALVVAKIVELTGADRPILAAERRRGAYSWKDLAILGRAHNHLEPFVAALKDAGVPYRLLGNRGLFDQEEIRELAAVLKVLTNPKDDVSFFLLLQSGIFGIEAAVVREILARAKRERKSLWEVTKAAGKGGKIMGLIEDLQKEVPKKTVGQLLYDFVSGSGFIKPFLAADSVESELRLKNINLFFGQIKRFEAESADASVFGFVNHLEMLLEAGESPAQAEIEDVDTVNLLTVHGAKGLEFPVVFLVNLVSDRFPMRRRGDPIPLPDSLVKEDLPAGDAHLEEERRLFYVGLTRAKDRLFLTWAQNYGGVKEKRPSKFIEELGLKAAAIKPPPLLNARPLRRRLPKAPPRPVGPAHISYSQLETFRQCPLKYRYRYVLGLPGEPSHTLSFGQTIHRTLRDFHRRDLLGEKGDLAYLLRLYEKHWLGEGYESRRHRELRFKEGREMLRSYFREHRQHLARPVFLERKFRLRLGRTILVGSIDRLDRLENGGYELIDYKTGKVKEQREVERDEQLIIYGLALLENFKIFPQRLSLYFVGENIKLSTEKSEAVLKGKRKELVGRIKEIEKSTFSPRFSRLCEFCEYRRLCPAYKTGYRF